MSALSIGLLLPVGLVNAVLVHRHADGSLGFAGAWVLFSVASATLLASSLMAGAVLALERCLPVPGIATFAVLAASGMLVYLLAAIALNICEARSALHAVSLQMFAAAQRNAGSYSSAAESTPLISPIDVPE